MLELGWAAAPEARQTLMEIPGRALPEERAEGVGPVHPVSALDGYGTFSADNILPHVTTRRQRSGCVRARRAKSRGGRQRMERSTSATSSCRTDFQSVLREVRSTALARRGGLLPGIVEVGRPFEG